MTKAQAKELLLRHSFMYEDVNHPKSEMGFLGMLRPFGGQLYEENYHEIMAALKVLANEISGQEKVDRKIVSALWGMCHLARAWAVYPEGMLRSNNLITPEQVQQIDYWVEDISYATMCLLEGAEDEAFHGYNQRNPDKR